jgi:hypothetical protein
MKKFAPAWKMIPKFKYHRLQPVGFSAYTAKNSQAEAYVTKSTESENLI